MKPQSLVIFCGVVFFALFGTLSVSAEACSCKAPNNSCETSNSCDADGCYAYCYETSCISRCVKDAEDLTAGGTTFGPQGLRTGPAFQGPQPSDLRYQSVTLQFDTARSGDVAAYLSSELGAQVSFTTQDSDELVTIDAKNLPAGEVIRLLGTRGGVGIASGGKIHLVANNLSASQVSDLLTESLGLAVEFVPENATRAINLDIKGAPIEGVLAALAEKGQVQFSASH
ncbi:MAG: hypothetical protein SX243_14140 [Acidobacteriota bacterium]|nr:hypothetical protein [Acidobacteriota bacterium]